MPGRNHVRKSRIAPVQQRQAARADNSNLRIKIELDLEMHLNLYATVKGDLTIGLM